MLKNVKLEVKNMSEENKDNLEVLLKENLAKTDLIVQKINRFEKEFKRAQLMNLIRFLIVAIPVILAILWLIPVFRNFLEIYQPLIDLLNRFRTI